MQCPDKILCQGHFFQGRLFLHHPQAHVARRHFLHIAHIRLSDHLAEKQQDFRLSIGQCIPFDMIAIVVEIDRKTAAKPFPVFLGQRL